MQDYIMMYIWEVFMLEAFLILFRVDNIIELTKMRLPVKVISEGSSRKMHTDFDNGRHAYLMVKIRGEK